VDGTTLDRIRTGDRSRIRAGNRCAATEPTGAGAATAEPTRAGTAAATDATTTTTAATAEPLPRHVGRQKSEASQ
jgi:hypothetical protein